MGPQKEFFHLDNLKKNELKEYCKQLQRKNEEFKAHLLNASMINELTKILHTCTDLNSIIKTVLLAIQELLDFDRVALFEVQKEKFCISAKQWVGFNDLEISHLSIPLSFEGGEITDALFLNRHIVVDDPDPFNDLFLKKYNSSSYLVIPLVSKLTRTCAELKGCTKKTCPAHSGFNPYCWSIMGAGQNIKTKDENQRRYCCVSCKAFKGTGVFWMDRTQKGKAINSDDIAQLTAIVNLAGIVIENYHNFEALGTANHRLQKTNQQLNTVNHDLKVAQSRIQCDLEQAQSIQQGLLPQNMQSTPALSVEAKYFCANTVGGDYYDVFELNPGVYGIVVADVSGHGIASALIMSMVKVLLKTFSASEHSPKKTLEMINNTFISDIKTDNFVTIFYAVLDTSSNTITFSSAGHCPILMINKNDASYSLIKADGLFMGVFPDMMLSEKNLNYSPGENRFVLYTDGLIEAQNENEDMYGIDKLISIAQDTIALNTIEAADAILNHQRQFSNSFQNEDDITLLIVDF
ncbi:SpoIIE family protein phosphatase [Chitinispirillales bacterium ANBcel5]|uniref:GAF domain-containing SpoIIE family protein phosphatase n=1 Tax=Cellulosispirillum alkaliphilum TaxID=3039283 RepID=UPI002A4EB04B|nr:SpoIIE family protein phosphatase [Chitinispirillales bacterium ANBcel5]